MVQFHYRCAECKAKYTADRVIYACEQDGANLDVALDYGAISAKQTPQRISSNPDRSIWRYEPLLPVYMPPASTGILRGVGGTRFFRAERIQGDGAGCRVWIKDDTGLPTASLKDRASALVVAFALERGIDRIITASTGNAGVALAGMAAAAGLEAVVVAPANAPVAKVAQILMYGARLVLVRGGYSEAFQLTIKAARELGWYCRNTGYNPLTSEGKKTVAFEICEQFTQALGEPADGRWSVPDRILIPVGDGNIISGIHKGFVDLMALGWIERMPKLHGVQAEGSAAIANAWKCGVTHIESVKADTVADSISADSPSDGRRALRAVADTGGGFSIVSDDEILAAMSDLARKSGVFAEPASAAVYAGWLDLTKRQGIELDEDVVLLMTGHGLKDTEAALRPTDDVREIEPSVEALRGALDL